MVRSKTLYCSSRFPWPREIISSKFIDNLDMRPQKVSPALHYSIEVENKWNYPSTHTPPLPVCLPGVHREILPLHLLYQTKSSKF